MKGIFIIYITLHFREMFFFQATEIQTVSWWNSKELIFYSGNIKMRFWENNGNILRVTGKT